MEWDGIELNRVEWYLFQFNWFELSCEQKYTTCSFLDNAAPSAPHLLHFVVHGACGAANFLVAAPAAPHDPLLFFTVLGCDPPTANYDPPILTFIVWVPPEMTPPLKL